MGVWVAVMSISAGVGVIASIVDVGISGVLVGGTAGESANEATVLVEVTNGVIFDELFCGVV